MVSNVVGFDTDNIVRSAPPRKRFTFMRDPVREYFERYPTFVYNPSESTPRQFDRLARQNRWPIGAPRFRVALAQVKVATLQRFDPSVEIPGPFVVDPSPEPPSEPVAEPIPETVSSDGPSPSPKTAKNARRRARRKMKKAAARAATEALEIAAGLEVDTSDAAGTAPLQEACAEADGDSKSEEIAPGVAGPVSGDAQTTSSQGNQLVANGKATKVMSDEQLRIERLFRGELAIDMKRLGFPDLGEAGGCNMRSAEEEDRDVTVVSIPVDEFGNFVTHIRTRTRKKKTSLALSGRRVASFITRTVSTTITPETAMNPIDTFFSKYSEFDKNRDRTLSVATQLNQLRKQEEWWGERCGLWVTALEKYRDALVLQFNVSYGTDTESLENWHRVLRPIGVGDMGTIEECKAIVRTIYVNLVDMIDASLNPRSQAVHYVFDSALALSDYTVSTRRFTMPSRSRKSKAGTRSSGPLEDFFKQYSCFTYNPNESASEQFHRLQKEAGWERNGPEQKAAWEGYLQALVGQFNVSYGKDEDDLTAWHGLLARIGVTDLPDSVKKCKQIIRKKSINLVDLINARDDPTPQIRHFANEVELSHYTLATHKVFPRDHDDAGSLLKYLLRHILSPDPGARRRGRSISKKNRNAHFVYDPSAPVPRNFDRLVEQNGWPIGSTRFKAALAQIEAALFQHFDDSIEVPGPPMEPEAGSAGHGFSAYGIESTTGDPVRECFERYRNFVYDPSESVQQQFDRLVQQNHWRIGSTRYEAALARINAALLQQYDPSYEVPELFVEPEPEPVSGGGWTSNHKVGKNARKKAKRKMKKAAAKALENAEGLEAGASDTAGTAPLQGACVEAAADGDSKPEGFDSSVTVFVPGDAQTVPPQAKQPTASDDVHTKATTDEKLCTERLGQVDWDTTDVKPTSLSDLGEAKSDARNERGDKDAASVVSTATNDFAERVGAGTEGENSKLTSSGRRLLPFTTETVLTSTVLGTVLNPIDAFFSQYPSFDANRDRALSVATQLNQLRKQEGWWGKRYGLWVDVLEKYQEALVLQFNASYGTDAESLENWHRVLQSIGLEQPGNVEECKAVGH
ncbi:hypothetical protein AN958_10843 [Leucoagaricus sp. SymC.cos]|nr:hypothetical protein AN958_10843 [Leucoagaricus sp. SymC.cos]